MIDIAYLRANLKEAMEKLQLRNVDKTVVADIISIDKEYRKVLQSLEELQSKKNTFNKTIKNLTPKEKSTKLKEIAKWSAKEKMEDKKLEQLANKRKLLLYGLPNIPADHVPVGKSDRDNVVIKTVGKKTSFAFQPLDYMTLAQRLDIIDTVRAAKVSGTRFGYLKGDGALLWFALLHYAIEQLTNEGFTLFIPPVLVKRQTMENTGYDSYTAGGEAYYLPDDDLFLVGTGEHALVPYHSGEILPAESIPLSYAAYSTCFRREAGSYGKDTKGILRVHQFDKLEMVVLSAPDSSWDQFERLVSIQERLVKSLGLPYHLLSVCTGDLPKPSAKVIDLECWLPSEQTYRETHSASNCTDYQARRNNIKFRNKENATVFPYILNATAMTPRTLISILENYQQKDGTIAVPEVLRPYMGSKKSISKPT